MSKIAGIGGTGMNSGPGLEVLARIDADTAYGKPSAPLLRCRTSSPSSTSSRWGWKRCGRFPS